MRRYFFIVLIFMPMIALGQGIITGTITDAVSKKPLKSVTVRMPGTYYGAISDASGRYTIRKIATGKNYTLEISFIGYKKIQKTGIAIAAGDSLVLNFALKESVVALDKDVVVIGERPLVDVEETQSYRAIGRETINQMVAENITDVVVQQPGVVTQNNEIFIRGGRGYEAAYLLDGVSIQDPLAGTGYGMQLSADALQEVEVITGGFNPEYGQATSGVVNIKTREGTENFFGSLSYRRAQRVFARNTFDRDTNSLFSTDILEMTVSGPEPISSQLLPALGIDLPGKIGIFLNFNGNFSDNLTPSYARVKVQSSLIPSIFSQRQDNSASMLGKLSWVINPSMKLLYSYSRNIALNQDSRSVQTNLEYVAPRPGYQYEFQGHFDGALSYGTDQQLNSLTWIHSLGASALYEVRISNLYTHLKVDANGKNFPDYREPRDIPKIPAEYYNTNDTNRLGIIPGDGFFDTGNGNFWREHYIDEWTLKGDYTTYLSEKNRIKTGIEFRFQEMQQAEIYQPWLGPLGLNNDVFKVNSTVVALYAQNNISFKGLVLNYGLRLDAWAPGKLVDNAIADTTITTILPATRESYMSHSFGFLGRQWKARLSPRLGVSHPVTNSQTLFFNYGHFNKLPRPQFVYAKLTPQAANSSYQKFGNPDLNPETTISYELGVRNSLSENDVLTFTAYYKDIFDYVQSVRVLSSNPRFVGGTFTTYRNSDYSRSRGVEVEYKKRIDDWFSGVVSATYSVVTGKSGSADDGALVARGQATERITEDYMAWDRPWQINATANFIVAKNKPLFGIDGLDDINAFIRFFFQSGQRYTPHIASLDANGQQQTLANGRPIYRADYSNYLGGLSDNWWWIDLNIQKNVNWGTRLRFSLEVLNVFDIKNSTIINPVTGRAYEYGDPTSLADNDPKYPDLLGPISPYPFNPARYTSRRSIRFGMTVGF
jgi:outer membrane receptor protein involved in Fe transport